MLLARGRHVVTPDVDVARLVVEVDEVAREIARERGLAMRWLNPAAGPWVPLAPTARRSSPRGQASPSISHRRDTCWR